MVKASAGRLLSFFNPGTIQFSLALDGQDNATFLGRDTGKRRSVHQVNRSLLRILGDQTKSAADLQQAIINLSDGRFLSHEVRRH